MAAVIDILELNCEIAARRLTLALQIRAQHFEHAMTTLFFLQDAYTTRTDLWYELDDDDERKLLKHIAYYL